MSANASGALAPRTCRTTDLAAMIGLLAVIEGELMTGEVPPQLADRMRDRLERVELLEPAATERDLRQALSDLNHRLRYAVGEYDEPAPPLRVPE